MSVVDNYHLPRQITADQLADARSRFERWQGWSLVAETKGAKALQLDNKQPSLGVRNMLHVDGGLFEQCCRLSGASGGRTESTVRAWGDFYLKGMSICGGLIRRVD